MESLRRTAARASMCDKMTVDEEPCGRCAGLGALLRRRGRGVCLVSAALGLVLLVWGYAGVRAPPEPVVEVVSPAGSSTAADVQRAQAAADRATIALLLDQGMVSAALSLAAENSQLDGPFRDNVELARYETSVLFHHVADSSEGAETGVAEPTEDLPSDVDDIVLDSDGALVVTQGRYAGVYVLAPAADGITVTACGEDTRFTRLLRPPSDPSLVLWDDDHIEHRDLPDCRSLMHGVPRDGIPLQEKETISAAVALDGESWAAIGTTDGRILSLVREQATLLLSRQHRGPVRHLVAGPDESRIAVLYGDGSLSLIRSVGGEAAAPIPFVREGVVETKDPVWLDFIAHLPGDRRVASLSYAEGNSPVRSPIGVLSFTIDRAGNGRIGRFFGERSSDGWIHGPLAARELPAREPYFACTRLEWMTRTKLRSVVLEDACGDETEALEASLPAVPVSAAAFCGRSPAVVMGSAEGDLLFARLSDSRPWFSVTIEHRERDWPDWITSVTCDDAGVVHAAYASSGIKMFSSPFRMTNECTSRAATGEGSGRFTDEQMMDTSWPVSVDAEPATLALTGSGQMSLLRGHDTIWLRHVASPAPYCTGDQVDFVSDVAIDHTRSRVWVLTSRGRLSVFDLASGAILATLETFFYGAAPPPSGRSFSGMKLEPGAGNVEFWAGGYPCREDSELHTVVSVADVRPNATGRDGVPGTAERQVSAFGPR